MVFMLCDDPSSRFGIPAPRHHGWRKLKLRQSRDKVNEATPDRARTSNCLNARPPKDQLADAHPGSNYRHHPFFKARPKPLDRDLSNHPKT